MRTLSNNRVRNYWFLQRDGGVLTPGLPPRPGILYLLRSQSDLSMETNTMYLISESQKVVVYPQVLNRSQDQLHGFRIKLGGFCRISRWESYLNHESIGVP